MSENEGALEGSEPPDLSPEGGVMSVGHLGDLHDHLVSSIDQRH